MSGFLKCPRCDEVLISDKYRSHKCPQNFKGMRTLGIEFSYDGGRDENDDELTIVKGVDGFFYKWIKCSHKIPHNVPHQPNFGTIKINLGVGSTLTLQPLFCQRLA